MFALTGILGLLCPAGLFAQASSADDTNSPADTNTAQKAEADDAEMAKSDSAKSEEDSNVVRKDAVVIFGQNVELKKGEIAEVIVVIGGSAKVHGKVRESVVVIGGDAEIDGEVGEEVVAVMGSVHARSPALIKGDVVSVGGSVDVEEGAKVRGHTQEVAIGGLRMPHAPGIQKWISSCLFMLRPLSPSVGWVWIIAFVHFLLFLFIAAVFRSPVQACVDELTRRPATTFIMGLLTKMLLPVIILILLVLVVGIVIIPFLVAALFVLSLVGKVAVLEAVGSSVARLFNKAPVEAPVVALVIGSVMLALLYMVPVVGLLTLLLFSVWSLGCAMTAAARGFRGEIPPKPAAPAFVPAYAPAMAGAASGPAPAAPFTQYRTQESAPPGPTPSTEPSAASSGAGATAAAAGAATLAGQPPVMPDVLVYPKATFWERIAADLLDLIFVAIIGSWLGSMTATLIIGLAYVTAMWAYKGTTIGGIVLGLKVVRVDGSPLSFAVALVRGLAAGFSGIVLFLGFIWIAWDSEKQGWHDKIAGTLVLKLPRGTPLVCF